MKKWNKEDWVGRVFRCNSTGETFTIPDDVRPKAWYKVGDGFVDVGNEYYARFGGDIEEVLMRDNRLGFTHKTAVIFSREHGVKVV